MSLWEKWVWPIGIFFGFKQLLFEWSFMGKSIFSIQISSEWGSQSHSHLHWSNLFKHSHQGCPDFVNECINKAHFTCEHIWVKGQVEGGPLDWWQALGQRKDCVSGPGRHGSEGRVRPVNQTVVGLIPSQGTCLGCGPGSWWGLARGNLTYPCFSPSFSLPSPLSRNE